MTRTVDIEERVPPESRNSKQEWSGESREDFPESPRTGRRRKEASRYTSTSVRFVRPAFPRPRRVRGKYWGTDPFSLGPISVSYCKLVLRQLKLRFYLCPPRVEVYTNFVDHSHTSMLKDFLHPKVSVFQSGSVYPTTVIEVPLQGLKDRCPDRAHVVTQSVRSGGSRGGLRNMSLDFTSPTVLVGASSFGPPVSLSNRNRKVRQHDGLYQDFL